MTSTPASTLRAVGTLSLVAGSALVALGGTAWGVVSKQLRDEDITVPPNAPFLAGKRVQDPLTAFAEAETIRRNAERDAGGRSFAEVAAATKSAEPGSPEAAELGKTRLMLATAASLRTSLMTSVLAFGVSALVMGVGALLLTTGARMADTDGD